MESDTLKDYISARQEYVRSKIVYLGNAPAIFRSAREKQGWTKQEMADELGVDITHISHIEAGRQKPSDRLSYEVLRLTD